MTDVADMTLEDLAERVRSSAPNAYLRMHRSIRGVWIATRHRINDRLADRVSAEGATLYEALASLLTKIEGAS